MNPDVDDWISQHCLDADVFVLVANSESTLMSAVRKKICYFYYNSFNYSVPDLICRKRISLIALVSVSLDQTCSF